MAVKKPEKPTERATVALADAAAFTVRLDSGHGTYHVGDLVTLQAQFTSHSGRAVDPTEVVFEVRKPDGTVDTITPTRLEGGLYQSQVLTTLPHAWHWRVTGTGAAPASNESFFNVRHPGF